MFSEPIENSNHFTSFCPQHNTKGIDADTYIHIHPWLGIRIVFNIRALKMG